MSLADTFKGLSSPEKVGLVGLAGGGAWFLWQRHKANSAAASSSSSPQLSTGIDPSTGVPYAQEESAYYNQPSQFGGLGFGSSFDPSQFFGPSGSTTSTDTSTPGPGVTASTPAPISSAVPDPTTLESLLDQQVGILSSITDKGSTPQQVQAYATAGQKQGLSGTGLNFYDQTQNIGTISNGLKTPQITDVNALAMQLAGGDNAFAGLPSLQQNQYKELANVDLLQRLNSKAA